MSKLTLILLWFIPIGIMIGINLYRIQVQKKRPPYFWFNVIKVILAGSLAALARFDVWYMAYQFFSFGAFFDPGLNLFLGKKRPDYINRTERASWMDKAVIWLSRWIPIPFQMFIEFILAMIMMTIYWDGWSGFVQMMQGNYDWSNWYW